MFVTVALPMSAVAPPRVWIPSVLGVLLVAALLRGQAVTDGFWFDEVWSCWNLDKLASWSDVFLGLEHDNNHQLCTLWMYMLGDQDNWVLYRIPSLLVGLITILLVLDRSRSLWGIVIPGGVSGFAWLLYKRVR